jgi:hypothetical protein
MKSTLTVEGLAHGLARPTWAAIEVTPGHLCEARVNDQSTGPPGQERMTVVDPFASEGHVVRRAVPETAHKELPWAIPRTPAASH